MQVSRHQVFIFMEGDNVDPYFYAEIAQRTCAVHGVTYRICRSREITGDNGGKEVLLLFFKYLRDRSLLVNSFKGKNTVSIFYFDKDIDDLLRRKITSDHVVYTPSYDVEDVLFSQGDITRAIAAAASISYEEAENIVGANPDLWRKELTQLWKEWITLCIFTAKKRINNGTNYRVPSRINTPFCTSVNQDLYANHLSAIRNSLNLSEAQFSRSYSRIASFVNQIYQQDEQEIVFKGKWYPILISEFVTSRINVRNSNGLQDRLVSTILVTIDFDAPWADYYKNPLHNLIQLLN
jgi:hypothetical protein